MEANTGPNSIRVQTRVKDKVLTITALLVENYLPPQGWVRLPVS
jgi:hypothetical protein